MIGGYAVIPHKGTVHFIQDYDHKRQTYFLNGSWHSCHHLNIIVNELLFQIGDNVIYVGPINSYDAKTWRLTRRSVEVLSHTPRALLITTKYGPQWFNAELFRQHLSVGSYASYKGTDPGLRKVKRVKIISMDKYGVAYLDNDRVVHVYKECMVPYKSVPKRPMPGWM